MRHLPLSPAPEVTPFAGVWIEMHMDDVPDNNDGVTPFAGVWIEISVLAVVLNSWHVTPFAGVWIEMPLRYLQYDIQICHSLRGSVD